MKLPTHTRFNNLTGKTFGRLIVVKFCGLIGLPKKSHWVCQCSCGNIVTLAGVSIVNGNTSSCGCIHREQLIKRNSSHGKSMTPEYSVWKGIHKRCSNPNEKCFSNYGERGITVCKRWNTFKNFLEDMGLRPSNKHSIERKSNNKGYFPSNCVWAIATTQQRNKRTNKLLTLHGVTKPLIAWSEELHINYGTLKSRLNSGWSDERALTTPVR